MNYRFINKLLSKSFTKFFPKTINRKLFRKYRIFFVPTDIKVLPINFYPVTTSLKLQEKLVKKFLENKKLINETSKRNLDKFLLEIFNQKSFSFFDVGGDNIDLYLYLSSKLNIKKYYISNFKEIIVIFDKLKLKFNYHNFQPVSQFVYPKNIDFVYFGSCIQYFKDYKSYLTEIIKNEPKYILFSGSSFFYDNIDSETVVVKQTNILPSTIFLYFFNFEKFINFFLIKGYKLVYKKKNMTNDLNYKNFYPMLNKLEYLDLMFEIK